MVMARLICRNTLVNVYSIHLGTKKAYFRTDILWPNELKLHVFLLTLGDMFSSENGENEPDWVTTEKKHFSEFRDMNKVCGCGKEIYQHHLAILSWFMIRFLLSGRFP